MNVRMALFAIMLIVSNSQAMDASLDEIQISLDGQKTEAKSESSVPKKAEEKSKEPTIDDAIEEGDIAKVVAFLDSDATLINTPLLTCAARYEKPDIIELLLKRKANVNARGPLLQFTPLLAAAFYNSFAAAQVLLEHKANVDDKSLFGFTALHMSASDGHAALVQLLLSHPQDINALDGDGTPALIRASFYSSSDHEKCVKQLLLARANTAVKNKKGVTAFDVAVNPAIRALLGASAKKD